MNRFIVLFVMTVSCGRCRAEPIPDKQQWVKWVSLESLGIDKNNPPANWSSKASHELLLKELAKKTGAFFYLLREEFLYMSPGEEFIHLYPDDDANAEYQAIAAATKHLWSRLPVIQKVSSIIKTSLEKAADSVERNGNFETAMAVLFENIERSMKEDPNLYARYLPLKEEAKNRSTQAKSATATTTTPPPYYEIPAKNENSVRLTYAALNKPANKRYIMNMAFLNETQKGTASSAENFALARSVLELAKSPEKEALVQRNYNRAIFEAAQGLEDYDGVDYPSYHRYHTSKTISAKLMNKLSEKFEKNPELSSDVEATKKIVIGYDN